MTTIKPPQPPSVRALEEVRAPEGVGEPAGTTRAQAPPDAPLAPVQSGASTGVAAPPPEAKSEALQSIGSLTKSEFFGKGAKVQPLRAGVQALDGPQDKDVLAQDLNVLLADVAAEDPGKRAAIDALLQNYPGGADALKGVE
jgi:hypothetical protein